MNDEPTVDLLPDGPHRASAYSGATGNTGRSRATSSSVGTRQIAIKSQRTESGQLLVSVSDTGIGLPQQHADQIFNAFFTAKADGTAMGLRISRSIIESHGGRLWTAENFPRGTIFQFTLPANVTTSTSSVA